MRGEAATQGCAPYYYYESLISSEELCLYPLSHAWSLGDFRSSPGEFMRILFDGDWRFDPSSLCLRAGLKVAVHIPKNSHRGIC